MQPEMTDLKYKMIQNTEFTQKGVPVIISQVRNRAGTESVAGKEWPGPSKTTCGGLTLIELQVSSINEPSKAHVKLTLYTKLLCSVSQTASVKVRLEW